MATQKYQITTSPVLYNGKRHEIGETLELSAADAECLAWNLTAVADDKAAAKPKTSDK